MTIEDEFGFSNLVIWEKLFEEVRKEILPSKLIMVKGKLQVEEDVVHVIVQRCHNFRNYCECLRRLIMKNCQY